MHINTIKKLITIIFGVVLFYCALPNLIWHIPLCSWVCFVPLLMVINREKYIFLKFGWSWLFFQLSFLLIFNFTIQELPENFNIHTNTYGIWLFFLGLPLIYSITFFLISFFQNNKFQISNSIIQTCIWGCFEILILEKTIGFPLSFAISNFQNLYFIQIASLGGITLVSCIIFFCNSALSQLIINKVLQKKSIIKKISYSQTLCLFLIIFILCYIWGNYKVKNLENQSTNKTKINISLIQPNISQYDLSLATHNNYYFKKQLNDLQTLSLEAKKTFNPDLIIWPESMLKEKIFTEEFYYPFKTLLKSLNTHLIVHSLFSEKGNPKVFSTSILFKKDILENINFKQKLVPIFETNDYSKGNHQNIFFNAAKNVDIGSTICFELLFSSIIKTLSKNGASIITCLSNTSYFGKSNWVTLYAAYTPFRAIEFRKPVILLNNQGLSTVTNEIGKILVRTPLNKPIICNVNISESGQSSLYEKSTHFLIFLLIIMLFLSFTYQDYKKGGELNKFFFKKKEA